MIERKLALIDDQTSPLFRIMYIHNSDIPARRQFDNNICAFHIGNGLILSVAHNLKTEAQLFKSIDQAIYAAEIRPQLDAAQVTLFERSFPLDTSTNKRYMNIADQNEVQPVMDILRNINFDTRWLTLINRNICKPFLIIQFRNNQFYNNAALTAHFNPLNYFEEAGISRHTFLVEVELVEAYYNEDIALYRIVNTPQEVIDSIPSIEPSFAILDDDQRSYYCLQCSPSIEAGKLLNKASIEGFTEHLGLFQDRIGGNYTLEGMRYLIKGYFRFGSSGAPYVVYDKETDKFKVNAIQSEACPIQLTINNNRNGNFQYINAIASPLKIIEDRLRQYLP